MAKILLFQHVPFEPLGTLSPLIRDRGHRVRYVNFSRDPNASPDVDKYDALIILGGPANVDQTDKYPHLITEMKAIQRAISNNIPVLGICLGCQLMATALGAKVTLADEKEIGWYALTTTQTGKSDPLIQHIQDGEKIFQWHGYTFELPEKTDLLVTAEQCHNQAFRLGQLAYGFQFHLEVNATLIKRWVNLPLYQHDLNQQDTDFHAAQILQDTEAYIDRSLTLSKLVFGAFLDLLPTVDRKIILPSR